MWYKTIYCSDRLDVKNIKFQLSKNIQCKTKLFGCPKTCSHYTLYRSIQTHKMIGVGVQKHTLNNVIFLNLQYEYTCTVIVVLKILQYFGALFSTEAYERDSLGPEQDLFVSQITMKKIHVM